MKKLLYTFLAVSIIFSACKKEDDEELTPTILSAQGVWETTLLEADGISQLDSVSHLYFYCWGDTLFLFEEFDLEGNISEVTIGTMSYNTNQTMLILQQEYAQIFSSDGTFTENFQIYTSTFEISKFTNTELNLFVNTSTGNYVIENEKTNLTLPYIKGFCPLLNQ